MKTVVEPTFDPVVWVRKHLEQADTDLLREMVRTFAQAPMSAEADATCGAAYGERFEERTNRRNGYREGDFDTPARVAHTQGHVWGEAGPWAGGLGAPIED